ncbi:MAG: 1-acyl-sn-glycerol-3-phosphate acyltransferase [Bacteroidales bacterium OttesenSCG-928-I14]|jgi:1-acyl-sn-glycerol-3-phosphate acyltransferase|nr:1-acyl-sn-glycerol-3-phosphate acyltransferase [Bacteroidales bacterium OttesenSCG-928-I14]
MLKFCILIYQIFIWVPLLVLCTILTSIITILGCLFGCRNIFSYWPGRIWSRFVCIITFCKVQVIGSEKLKNNQSYVFVANHQGIYDCWLIFGYLGMPIKWVMKQNLRKIPLVGKACEMSGFIFVDNSSQAAAVRSIIEIKKKFKNTVSVVIFPEGSRTKTGKLGKFKKGAFKVAFDLHVPIVPITINGSYEVMPRNSVFIHPNKMKMTIHEPIVAKTDLISNSAAQINILMDKSLKQIRSALWEQYK